MAQEIAKNLEADIIIMGYWKLFALGNYWIISNVASAFNIKYFVNKKTEKIMETNSTINLYFYYLWV